MTNTPATDREIHLRELTLLCARYLQREEALLTCTLPVVRSIENALGLHDADAFAPALRRHGEVTERITELNRQRRSFRDAAARILDTNADTVTMPAAIAQAPAEHRNELLADLTRVRKLAAELAAATQRITVHLRIHLAAYRHILRDLTNTDIGSGRYGPAGKAESLEYRPLIQMHG